MSIGLHVCKIAKQKYQTIQILMVSLLKLYSLPRYTDTMLLYNYTKYNFDYKFM